jgi:hypothetical protein
MEFLNAVISGTCPVKSNNNSKFYIFKNINHKKIVSLINLKEVGVKWMLASQAMLKYAVSTPKSAQILLAAVSPLFLIEMLIRNAY